MSKFIKSFMRLNQRFPRLYLLIFFMCLGQPQSHAEEQQTIRFGVLSIAQPSRIFAKWQPFAEYMSQRLGQPVEIVIPRGFGKMKKTIAEGGVDFFYINSHVFYRLKQEGKAIGVAQMQNIDGKTTSRSDIFVNRDSGIEKIIDLKGKNIAFVSPMGAGGYLAPRAHLYKSGLKSGTDSRESFTKNLSNSIVGVLLGDYDAAAMCGVNYKLMSKKIETGELKIITSSDEYPENVIGARSNISSSLLDKFRNHILTMKQIPEGKLLLSGMHSMKIKSFTKYDESIEEITRSMLETAIK